MTVELGHDVSLKEPMLFDDQPTGGGVFRSTAEGTYSSTTARLKKNKTTHPPTRDSFRGGKLCKTDLQSEFISNLCLIVVDETMTPGLFATSDVFLCL